MKITAVVCTYNRGESLGTTLTSLATMKVPESVEWEVLLVDNNSSDQSRKIGEAFCRRYPGRFRYVFEPKQGLSHARNRGIREAKGEIIAFTDDDVTADSEWLQNLTAPLQSGEWAGGGGRVLPLWTCAVPRWLPNDGRYALAPLTVFDLGPIPGQLAETPFGANMAYRREVFWKYGCFRTDLGRRPGSLIGHEDVEFGNRLLAAGERLRYEPSAKIYHPVQDDRIQKKYFLSWWYAHGRAEIMQSGISCSTRWRIDGIPISFVFRLAVCTLRWIFTVDVSKRFSRKLTVWTLAGKIWQCFASRMKLNPVARVLDAR
jgi:glycosyltransferase involved in cell wall biosynthesis